MKKQLLAIGCFFLAFSALSQTSNHRIGITFGGGSQKYSGDLGNAFTLKNRVWRGGFVLSVNTYLSKSFDVGIYSHIGDLGYCQPHDMVVTEVADEFKCDGCIDRVGLGNLSSRMYTAGASFKYKFNNDYILRESFRIKPYLYVGVSMNKLADRMKMNCINAGNYVSFNAGIGARYYLNERLNVGYNLNLGYFASDKMDFISLGKSDLYLQNSITIGIDLF